MGRVLTNQGGGRRWWISVGLLGLLFVLLALVVPLAVVVQRSLDAGFDNFADALASASFIRSLGNTAVLAVGVTLCSAVIGYPYAYAMARSGRVVSRILLTALMLSFWTSLLVRSYAWQVILNDTGLVNEALQFLGVIDEPLQLIRTPAATLIGMTHILVPFTILAIFAQLRGISPDLAIAARGLGATRTRAFWSVTFPLSLPGLAAGSLLVFVLTLGYYVTPQLLGGAGNPVIGQSIVEQTNALLNTGVGSAMAVILLLIVVVILGVAARFLGLGRVLGLATERSDR
ncbi:ABC transporter permease [Labedella phragmitis]|uniref:ABC transporter permease n=1 Tax=Labedella phragmitis TaxID=2498849 RepID=A0A444PYC5_9MICO|nr:ABC transporter permease [Labedella phragmitis]RWZ52890.1 ABC transporter permease [Labedella phragmitis]